MTTNNIFIIDSRVADYQRLMAALPSNSEAFLLNPDQDGIEQMQEILSNYHDLDSIQIVSHGAQGALYLGSTILSQENIENYQNQLGDIGYSLTATGDLLLYGCNVAQGDQGQQFISRLALFTGADVAASDDLTGNAALGGDWELETATGAIETAPQSLRYEGLLGLTVSPNIQSFPGHTLGEFSNELAFAALKADGSVVTWGNADYGGDSSSIASQLVKVTQIYSTVFAFAALKADGSVATWGDSSFGGNSSSVASQLVNVTQIYSSLGAFAALKADGSVVTWGNSYYGSNSASVASQLVNVTQIFSTGAPSTGSAFAALKADGSVVTWGNADYGGDSTSVASQLVNVKQIYSTKYAFAALKEDGSVVTWGYSLYGGLSAIVDGLTGSFDLSLANQLVNVKQIFSTFGAFAALKGDGSVVTWGLSGPGGDSSYVASELVNVKQIYSTNSAFAALKEDGSVVTWGSVDGGNSASVASELVNVKQIYSTKHTFAALKEDGSVVTWGDPSAGGDSSSVASQLVNVTQIYSSANAFAALRADGSVVTWGDPGSGGDSSSVASALDGTIDVTQIYSSANAFAALRADGSVVTWGSPGAGGDSTSVASQLSSGVVSFANIYTDDFYTVNPAWQITPNATVVSEADGKIEFTITRPDDRLGSAETVYVSTTQNHGSVNTNDYVGLLSLPYTFAAGENIKTVSIDILSDNIAESDETFGLIVQANPTDPISNTLASTTFTISENLIPPANQPPTAQPISPAKNLQPGQSIVLSELFTWNDPNGLSDVVSFAVRDRGISGGYLTENGVRLQDNQLFDNVPITEIANWAFVAGEAGSVDDVAFNAIDAAGAFNTPSAVSTVTATTEVTPPILQKPSEIVLEYFAKGLAYDPRLEDSIQEDSPQRVEIESQWGDLGYKISKVFKDGTFLAVGLTGINKEPVLAIRGTVGGLDWIENFDISGVGYTEFFDAWNDPGVGLKNWLTANPGANITGHSQGGGQAQLLAAAATNNGIKIGNLLTFNSPGIAESEKNKFNPSLAGDVKHVISSGDIVQLVGDSFIPGNEIYRYNFDNNRGTKLPFDTLLNAHADHWSNLSLYLNPFHDGRAFTEGYDGNYTGSLTLAEYEKSSFSYLHSGNRFDGEYFQVLMAVARIPDVGPALAAAMTTRGTVSASHKVIGAAFYLIESITELGRDILQIIEAATQAMIESGKVAWEAVSKWTANKWQEIKGWTVETWQKAKGWTAEVWEATVNGTKDFFNALKEKTTDAVNALVESGHNILDSIDPKTQVASPLILGFLSKNESVEVVVPVNGVATAPLETPTILIGTENNETLYGGSKTDLFFGGAGNDTLYLGQSLRTLQNLSASQEGQQAAPDILSQGSDIVVGTAADLNGDTIFGFANDDAVFFVGAFFGQNDLLITKGSAILQADVDHNGSNDFTLTLKGQYQLDQFVVETQELGTLIRYQGALETVLVDDNGTVNEDASITFSFAQLLANDINVDGVNQTIAAVDVIGTKGGVVIDSVKQTITYTADADEFDLLANGANAMDSFKYIVQGSSGETSTATVAINVAGVDDGISLSGTVRRDILHGTSGEDRIKGNNGNDVIYGHGGADNLLGENGNDWLFGGNSIDNLFGGNGNDKLFGENGNDWLNGEKGVDILTGGSGSDVFAFAKAGGKDIVTDFTDGVDKIQIAANTGITNFSQLKITGKSVFGVAIYTTIDLGPGDKITLTGVSSAALDATDFIFAA